MIAAWQGSASFRGESRVRTWLLGIAHHKASNVLRKRRREILRENPFHALRSRFLDRKANSLEPGHSPATESGASATSFEQVLDRKVDRSIDLHEALRKLPEDQGLALELVFLNGLSVQETAEVLGIAPGTVKSRLFRAKAKMRSLLEAHSEEDDLNSNSASQLRSGNEAHVR